MTNTTEIKLPKSDHAIKVEYTIYSADDMRDAYVDVHTYSFGSYSAKQYDEFFAHLEALGLLPAGVFENDDDFGSYVDDEIRDGWL